MLLSLKSFTQTLSPKVMPSSGNYNTEGSVSISWTLGQPFSMTLQGGSTFLTQGQQQPNSPVSLPLTWISVSGYLNAQKHSVINWKVDEQNVANYSVEKKNSSGYNSIGFIPSLGNGLHTYSFIEQNPLSGEGNYRIKQIDIDGHYSYSSIIVLRSITAGEVWIYPNPATDKTTIYTNDQSLINSQAILIDINGKELQKIIIQSSTVIDLSSYSQGMYLVKLKNGVNIQLIKALQ
jgi:hypothetical protein